MLLIGPQLTLDSKRYAEVWQTFTRVPRYVFAHDLHPCGRTQLSRKGFEHYPRPFASHIDWTVKFHIFGVFCNRIRTAWKKGEGLRQSRMYQYQPLSYHPL